MSADPEILSVILTDSQRDALAPIVRKASRDRQGVIFFTAAPFIDAGRQAWRLQAKFLGSRDAAKVLKLLEQNGSNSAETL